MNKSKSNGLISKAIVKSNLKRFTPLMVMGIVYFFCLYVLPAFFVDDLSSHLRGSLDFGFFAVRFYCAAMPLAVSLALCNFLHKKNAVMFHHSIPVKRTQMYLSIVIAGLIIMFVPIVLLSFYISAVVNIATALKILGFGILSSTYVFSICILAGIISGTTVMHFILAIWFNFLPQSIYAVLVTYSQVLLFGFTTKDIWNDVALMSPETNTFSLLSTTSLVYIGIFVVIYILAGFLYSRAKLERTENAVFFNSIKVLLNALTSIYTMAIFGFIIYALKQTTTSFIVSSIIDAIIGSYAGYMILNKTFKIFNKQATKITVCIVVLSMILSLSFMLDFYRFESRVPNVNDVKSVKLNSDMLDDNNSYEGWSSLFDNNYTNRDIISNVINVQKAAIDNENKFDKTNGTYSVYIEYKLKNGKSISREYEVSLDNKNIQKYMKYIYESKSFKEKTQFSNIENEIKEISVSNSETDLKVPARYIDDLIETLDKDRSNMSYEQNLNGQSSGYELVLDLSDKEIRYFSISVKNSDKGTLEFIEKLRKEAKGKK